MSTNGTKAIKGRISHKHGTEEHWILSVYTDTSKTTLRDNPFIPLAGELIVYDPDSVYDYPRFKFGDPDDREGGRRNVDQLPFVECLAIENVDSIEDIPDNGSRLYRYTDENGELSHLVEVVETYHAGGANQVFAKTSTSNGGSVLNATTILSHFDTSLSNFVTFGTMTEVYALHYAMPFSGIRIGKSKGIGTMEVNMLQDGALTFRKYFGYNASTEMITSYDSASVVIVDGNTYNFTDDTTELLINLSAGSHTITSFDGSSGRIILTSFIFGGDEYYTYDKSQYIARLSDVALAKEELLGASDEANTILGIKSKTDQTTTVANSNSDRITSIENIIGDNQIFTLNENSDGEMPGASSGRAGKLWKWEDKLYESINTGTGSLKEFLFALPGTSELTDNYLAPEGQFKSDVGNEVEQYLQVTEFTKAFKNNTSIKLGSSSATGRIVFTNISGLPFTSIKIGVQAYNSSGSGFVISCGDAYKEYYTTSANEKTIILQLEDGQSFTEELIIETVTELTDANGSAVPLGTRGNIVRLTLEFGEVEYKWRLIGSSVYQPKEDEALATDSKEVVGAINELKQQFDDGGADGNDGREIELLKGNTHIQWRYVGDDTWTNLVALADLKGANGKEVQLQKTTTHIQWRLTDGSWANLVALSDLKGTSVTITNVSQNDSAGGTSIITFSDGKTLNIKNGTDGKTPVKGTDYFTTSEIDDIAEQAAAKVDIDVFVKSGTNAKEGLVPAPPTTAGTTKYLREDGTWVVPTNSTYLAGTGLTLASDNKTFNHNNSVDAVDTAGLYKIKYDAQGHITGTESFSLPTKNSWNYDDRYLAKVTYEWNNQIACGSGDSGAVSFGRYKVYDTQITFDIVSTTTRAISGKLVIATQNGAIMQAVVYGDASGQLASRLRIYQSAISGSRSWIEVFGMFDAWSKNKAHIYAIGLDSSTVQKQYTKVTQTGSAVKEPVEITSGDTKWAGTITDAIQSQIPSETKQANWDTAYNWGNHASVGYTKNTGTVTSVGLSVPTGFSVSNSPITSSGTLTLSFADGYSLPTTAKQANWDTAYGWGNHASQGYTKNTGTVTSVATGTGLSGGTITTSGEISLANATARTIADIGSHHLTYRDEGEGAMGYDNSIFIGAALGELNATTFRVNQKSTIEYVTDYDALVFNFS